jgi:hypothetical protein
MLAFLRDSGKLPERKARLFAVACCRHLLGRVQVDPLDVHAVDVAERYADGESTATELETAARYVPGPQCARRTAAFACRDTVSTALGAWLADPATENAAWAAGEHAAFCAGVSHHSPEFAAARATEKSAQAVLLRDVFFNPFRAPPAIAEGVLAWNDGCVVKLASSIYEERAFTQERMGVLADALEEAGLTDEEVLNHLRGRARTAAAAGWWTC